MSNTPWDSNASPYQPLTPPQPVYKIPPKKKGHKGLVIVGGVVGLLMVGGVVSAATHPSDFQAKASTTAAAPATTQVQPSTKAPETTQAPPPPPKTTAPAVTVSQQQAVKKAESYLKYTAFSRTGLIGQLVFEGFTTADATYAVDHITVDWTVQADLKAKAYMKYTAFSRKGLIEQLVFEGFTPEQAAHGATSVGL